MDYYTCVKKLRKMGVYKTTVGIYPLSCDYLYEYNPDTEAIDRLRLHPEIFTKDPGWSYIKHNFDLHENTIIRVDLSQDAQYDVTCTYFIENGDIHSRYGCSLFEDARACKYVGKNTASIFTCFASMTKYQKRKTSI